MSTGAAASAQPNQGPPQEDDLRRQDTEQEDVEQDQGSGDPNTPPPSGDDRHARGYPRRGRAESDTSSRKSARSAWRKDDHKKKAKDEEKFHARGGQPPKVPTYRGHADSQTFRAFERAVEIWVSRAEHLIPPEEQGLALLDALKGAEPGTYLSGKDWRTFRVKNGVEILMNLLRPHYETGQAADPGARPQRLFLLGTRQ